MGTNFYLFSKNKKLVQKYAPYSYKLTDEPDFGYEIHIAKTSCGWLPSFQAHKSGINSVKKYKEAYDTGEFQITDECGNIYTWDEFDERVLQFNGGTVKNRTITPVEQDKSSMFYDCNMPDHIPVSHFEYGNWGYKDEYFTDEEGFEFCIREFC